MAAWVMFGETLVEGLAQILEGQKNKTAESIGQDLTLIDTVTTAILQKNAEIKGLTIDWTDPTAVLTYLQTLPTFVPIPDPNAAPAAAPAPAPTPAPAPAAPAAQVEELPDAVSPANPTAAPTPATPAGPLPVVPGE
jgi:hypothetical protein